MQVYVGGIQDLKLDSSGASKCSCLVDGVAGYQAFTRAQFLVSQLWWDSGPRDPPPGWAGCDDYELSSEAGAWRGGGGSRGVTAAPVPHLPRLLLSLALWQAGWHAPCHARCCSILLLLAVQLHRCGVLGIPNRSRHAHRWAGGEPGRSTCALGASAAYQPVLAHRPACPPARSSPCAAEPVTQPQIAEFSGLLGRCLEHAIGLGLDVAINVSAAQHSAAQHSTAQHSTAQHCSGLHQPPRAAAQGAAAPALRAEEARHPERSGRAAGPRVPARLLPTFSTPTPCPSSRRPASCQVHADDGRAQNGWRNTLAFDPLQPASGFSFFDIMLAPIADALNLVLLDNSTAWMSLQARCVAGPPVAQSRQGGRAAPPHTQGPCLLLRAGRDGRHRVPLPMAVG